MTRRPRLPLPRALAGSAVVALAAGTLVALGGQASAAPVDDTGDVTVTVLADDGGRVTPDAGVPARVTVTNDSGATVPEGRVVLTFSANPVADRAELDAWLSGSSTATTQRYLGEDEVPELLPGETTTITGIEIDPERLELADVLLSDGVYRMTARMTSGTLVVDDGGAFVWQTADAEPTVDASVVVPLTLPAAAAVLADPEELEEATGPTGTLTRQLDALEDGRAAVGVDPRILASIRALGVRAPDSATDWLDRLERADLDTFPLEYADADPGVQVAAASAAGRPLDALLEPGALADRLDPADFPQEELDSLPEPSASGSPASRTDDESAPEDEEEGGDPPADDEAPSEDPELPTTDQLLAWDWTRTDLRWPASGRTSADAVSAIQAASPDGEPARTIVSGADLSDPSAAVRAAASTEAGADVLVGDAGLSASLRRAAAAPTARDRDDAVAAMSLQAAVLAGPGAEPDRDVLFVADRSWADNPTAFGRALEAIADIPEVDLGGLDRVADAEPVAVSLAGGEPDASQVDLATPLFEQRTALSDFSSAFTEGADVFRAEQDAAILSLLSARWAERPADHGAALDARRDRVEELLGGIAVVTASQFNMISGQASLPFSVRNDTDYPIDIGLRAEPSNPRLDVETRAEASIAANSRSTVQLPVQARLGNGEVDLGIRLFSADGVELGGETVVTVNVRADWEGIGAVGLVSVVVLLFAGGVIRTVRRRRRDRAAEAASDGGTDG